jgi:DNA repair protein RAD5
MTNWWDFYYTHKFNKLLKVDLQQLCIEYNIDPKQNKYALILELVQHFRPQNIEQEIIEDNNEDPTYFYNPSCTTQTLPYDHEFTIGDRSFRISDSLRTQESFLRHKLRDINYVDHQEIKIQINSILDVIKKPNTVPIEQPENMIPLLFDHQKQNIQWMKEIEYQVDNSLTFSIHNYYPYLIKIHPQLIYNCYNYRFQYHIPKVHNFTYQGGILADDIGLGKTISCIGLCLEKSREPKISHGDLYAKANLVLCPSHLAQQWFDEIENNTVGLKVCMIRTKRDWELLSYKDILTSDIVIVTHQFLVNPYFYNYRPPFNHDLHRRHCNLHAIHWHRIFLDEGHELVYNNRIFNEILSFQSKYKWYISGTPFIDGNVMDYPDHCVYQVAKFLGIKIHEREVVAPQSVQSITPNLEFMRKLTNLMIRNTKESANIHLPSITIEDKLLHFHKTEKGRYDIAKSRPRASRKWLLQLCCSLNLADQDIKEFGVEKTLEQIHEIMIENQEKKLKQKQKTLENTIPKREDTALTPDRKEIIDRLTKEIKDIQTSLTYLKTVLSQINNEHSCPVCLEIIEDLAITDCGHVFCVECIEQCLNTNGKCPNCRNRTSYMIVGKEQVNNEENQMINQYGTKITELIKFLKNTNEKVIIFSQWDRLLHKVGDILNEESLPNVFCQGSVFQRNKCLQEFRKKNIQILMMSLHYAVSGTNLTEAHNVIILDIYDGTKEDIVKKESQAIGRVHRLGQTKNINVIRFVMKDTLEEELYKKLINNNNQEQNERYNESNNDLFENSESISDTETEEDYQPLIL